MLALYSSMQIHLNFVQKACKFSECDFYLLLSVSNFYRHQILKNHNAPGYNEHKFYMKYIYLYGYLT